MNMNVIQTGIPDLLILEPRVFGDSRGFFLESFNARTFSAAVGREVNFVQDNHSRSQRGVLRGLHYQLHNPQAKLVRVTRGSVLDVAVDLRRSSPHFGQSVVVELSEENNRQLWLPEGFAHGFLVLSESADFLYKASDFYAPAQERCLLWNDPVLKIEWPLENLTPVLSAKDQAGLPLAECEVFE
jgi:dTDP-4-dehydrorhamnose 3,5-epimerase